MRRCVLVAASVLAYAVPSLASANPPEEWVFDADGIADEFRPGDVDGDGHLEIALIVNGGNYDVWPPEQGSGSLVLLDSSGNELWSFETGEEMQGAPAMGDLDGDGYDEIVVCESSPQGVCYALDGDGSIIWTHGPYYWPALWSMGPEIADVDLDGSLEVMVHSYCGAIAAVDGATGQLEWKYDAWTNDGELFYGGAAIGNIDGDPAPEIVLFGYNRGYVFAMDGVTGEVDLMSDSLYDSFGNNSWATTPVLADLDSDGINEIILTAFGWNGNPATYAMNGAGEILWRTEAVGELAWIGPGVGDTDGDGYPEVYVQDLAGNLTRHDAQGNVEDVVNLGPNSWAEPTLVDATGDLHVDVIGGSFDTVGALDASDFQTEYDYERPGAAHWAPIVADIDLDGQLELVTVAWMESKLVVVETGVKAGDSYGNGELAVELRTLAIATENVASVSNSDAAKELEKAAKHVWKAAEDALTRDFDKAFKEAFHSLKELEKAGADGADVNGLIGYLFDVAAAKLQESADRALALGDEQLSDEMLAALAAMEQAVQQGDLEDAAKLAEDAFKDLNKVEYQGSNCPESPGHDRLARQCQLVATIDLTLEVMADSDTPGKAVDRLDKAVDRMQKMAEELARGNREKAAQNAKEALKELDEAIKHGGDPGVIGALKDELVKVLEAETQAALVSAQLVLGGEDSHFVAAQAEFATGQAHANEGRHEDAVEAYKKAVKDL